VAKNNIIWIENGIYYGFQVSLILKDESFEVFCHCVES